MEAHWFSPNARLTTLDRKVWSLDRSSVQNTHMKTPSRSDLVQRPCEQHTVNMFYSLETRLKQYLELTALLLLAQNSLSFLAVGIFAARSHHEGKVDCSNVTGCMVVSTPDDGLR